MTFDVRRDDDSQVVVIGVEGQLLVGNRKELSELVTQAVEDGDRKFVLDFTSTGFIDSSGLAALLALAHAIDDAGGQLRLAGLNEDLRSMLSLTKLEGVFAIDDVPEASVAAFS